MDRRVVPGAVLTPRPPRWVLPVAQYRLTGRFEDRGGLWRRGHTGVDFAAPAGTPIRSIGSGRILAAAYEGRYGYKIVLRLASGTELWFCHQSRMLVTRGDRVRVGQVIGTVGTSGNTTGPHLHLEVRLPGDRPVDPVAWLRAHGLQP